MPENFENEEYHEAADKFEKLGTLGVTAEDHTAIHSSPPPELAKNPGKTLAELMSDEEIAEWLKGQQEALKELSRLQKTNAALAGTFFAQGAREKVKKAIRYLKTVGRLPKEFEGLDENTL